MEVGKIMFNNLLMIQIVMYVGIFFAGGVGGVSAGIFTNNKTLKFPQRVKQGIQLGFIADFVIGGMAGLAMNHFSKGANPVDAINLQTILAAIPAGISGSTIFDKLLGYKNRNKK
ncbi:DUF4257 domain-containing protein [Pseudobacillus badius]|uniref:DUF4257 domain-containing protein n=1 Tax=Bacillus badius TaxID=1455 RepID=UPI003D328828